MIEIRGVGARDVKVNYKLFKVSARVSGKNLVVASFMVARHCAGGFGS